MHVVPAAQAVGPAYVAPPHCPYFPCDAPVAIGLAVLIEDMLLTLVVNVVELATRLDTELDPAAPAGLEKHPVPVHVRSNQPSTNVAFVWISCVTPCALVAVKESPYTYVVHPLCGLLDSVLTGVFGNPRTAVHSLISSWKFCG